MSNSRQSNLEKVISRLANTSKVLDECEEDPSGELHLLTDLMLSVYSDEQFRHEYHCIFDVIHSIYKGESPGNLESLSVNLDQLKKFIDRTLVGNPCFKKNFNKFYDHICLELSRFQVFTGFNGVLDSSNRRLDQLNDSLTQKLKDVKNLELKISSIQSEFVTILGIFSAIIISAIGGISFTNATLSGILKAPLWKIVVVSSICGLVVFNIIFGMMYFVGKVTNKNIYANCKEDSCLDCPRNCWPLTIIRKRLPYVFWINIYLVLIAIAAILVRVGAFNFLW